MKFGKRNGFSLIELVVCIGILTTGLIFIVEIFSTMLAASTKGADWSVATYLLVEQLDALSANTGKISTLYPGTTIAVGYSGGYQEPTEIQAVNNVTYNFTYAISKINNNVTPAGTSTQIYKVDDSAAWRGATAASNYQTQGYGTLYLKMSRLIYVH